MFITRTLYLSGPINAVTLVATLDNQSLYTIKSEESGIIEKESNKNSVPHNKWQKVIR